MRRKYKGAKGSSINSCAVEKEKSRKCNEEKIQEPNGKLEDEIEGDLFKTIVKVVEIINKNTGAITWISTVILAVTAAVLKFMWYVSKRGELYYWNIDSSVISLFDNFTLYNIVLLCVMCLFVLLLLCLPAIIVKSKIKMSKKIIYLSLFFIGFVLFMLYKTRLYVLVNSFGVIALLIILVVFSIVVFILFAPSWFIIYETRREKKKIEDSKDSKVNIVLLGLMSLVILTLYFWLVGYTNACYQTKIRLTEDGYVIIYEAGSCYYLAEYDEDAKEIQKEKQVIVQKENVKFEYIDLAESEEF